MVPFSSTGFSNDSWQGSFSFCSRVSRFHSTDGHWRYLCFEVEIALNNEDWQRGSLPEGQQIQRQSAYSRQTFALELLTLRADLPKRATQYAFRNLFSDTAAFSALHPDAAAECLGCVNSKHHDDYDPFWLITSEGLELKSRKSCIAGCCEHTMSLGMYQHQGMR